MNANPESRTEQPRGGMREHLALQRVVSYLWADEAVDYHALPTESRAGHVFEDLLCLKRWLRRVQELEQSGFRVIVLRKEGKSI